MRWVQSRIKTKIYHLVLYQQKRKRTGTSSAFAKRNNKSIEIAFGTKTEPIDVGLLNEKPFSVAGIGFDAKVAFTFSQKRKRT